MQQSKKAIKESARIKREEAERRKAYSKVIMDAWKRWKGQTEKERKTWEEIG
mgnify:CR=1 FL=1